MTRARAMNIPATAITIALATALAGITACSSSTGKSPHRTIASESRSDASPKPASSGTLADLEAGRVVIDQRAIEEKSAERALESYRQAAWATNDPLTRAQSLQRIADLSLDGGTSPKTASHSNGARQESERRQQLDAVLIKDFVSSANRAESTSEAAEMLRMADDVASATDAGASTEAQEAAIQLYRTIIARSDDPSARAEAYYMLAKALDFAGKTIESRKTLMELSRLYPESPHYIEAQFRLGEAHFSEGDYDLASPAYSEVVHAGEAIPFFEQALYKRGWSYYKSSDYERSLNDFIRLIEMLEAREQYTANKASAGQSGTQMLNDAYRVTALAFSNLEGHRSVTRWLAARGSRPYEHKLYRALGDLYLRTQRFGDAAEAFQAFATRYPQNEMAPEFSSAAIKALQSGGFPTQVLAAKEQFVAAHGVESAYWKNNPQERASTLPLLKTHLLDLARHHHAQGQRTGDAKSYQAAAAWYSQLIRTDPDDQDRPGWHQSWAEALYAAGHFAPAAREFEQVAYTYGQHSKAAEAGYLGVVALQDLTNAARLGKAQGIDFDTARDQRIAAGLRFARAFPEHPKRSSVLQGNIESQLQKKDYAGAVASAEMLVTQEPRPEPALLKYGWQTIADGRFDMGEFSLAEAAYQKVLSLPGISPSEQAVLRERLAASIYKQGEALASSGKQLEAAAEYIRVSNLSGSTRAGTHAEFDAATIYLKMEQWSLAIPVLEGFRKRYPNDPLTETIPDKLALAYEKTGNWVAAATELEKVHDRTLKTEPGLARVALWHATELLRQAGSEDGLIRLYGRYQSLHPSPLEQRMEAQFQLALLHEKRADLKARDAMVSALAASSRSAGTQPSPRVNYLSTYAALQMAEPLFRRYIDYKLRLPLKTTLVEKRRLAESALDAYNTITRSGVAEFVTAAQFRTAEIYRVLAADIMTSERPRGLDELALEQYGLLLEEQALPFEDQAIAVYQANASLTSKGIYDQWVRRSFQALATLQPGRYRKSEQVESHVDIIY